MTLIVIIRSCTNRYFLRSSYPRFSYRDSCRSHAYKTQIVARGTRLHALHQRMIILFLSKRLVPSSRIVDARAT